MALTRSITVNDTTYASAYSRITSVRCDKSDAFIYVCTYADEASRLNNDFPVHTEERSTPLATVSSDLFAKSYEFLKTCEGYEDAVDHLAA